jgi:hypothetical protein
MCSSYLPLGIPNWTVTYIINTVPHHGDPDNAALSGIQEPPSSPVVMNFVLTPTGATWWAGPIQASFVFSVTFFYNF